MNISCLVIDDEQLARQRLSNLIQEVPELTLIDTCSTGKEAIEQINLHEPDLIFLDIRLKDMNGFSILEDISPSKKPLVIFVSAFDQYALKAFDYLAFDYLLKPFKDDRFFKAIHQVIEHLRQDELASFDHKINNLIKAVNEEKTSESKSKHLKNKLSVKLGNKISFIPIDAIKYITASGYYAEIFTADKKHLIRESLSNLIQRLNSNDFIRIHRSTIINVQMISELIHSNHGEIDIKTNDNKLFRVSKSYKKALQTELDL